jgi:Ala-tRNA(Pro) deacylase
MVNPTYTKLIELLDKNNAHYRLIDHPPEGRTEIVSPMRGNELSQAAKCIVIMVKLSKKEKKYVLGVVPGDAKIDLNAIKELFDGKYVSFADADIAEKLAGSVSGTVLPFSFNSELELIVDPSLKGIEEIYFNAARLDQSMALNTDDYVKIAKPRFENIVKSSDGSLDKESSEVKMSPMMAAWDEFKKG